VFAGLTGFAFVSGGSPVDEVVGAAPVDPVQTETVDSTTAVPAPTSRPAAELAAGALKAPLEGTEAPAPVKAAPAPAVTEYFVPNFVANADLLALRPTPKPQAAVASVPPPKPTPNPTLPPAPAPTPTPTSPQPGEPTHEQWMALRMCESTNNYSIISPPNSKGDRYYGAYQFGLGTWRSVADRIGRPDLYTNGLLPSDASREDQDAMALALWQDRSWQPWPTCGPIASQV
jgi:hypothetical protein